MKKILYSAPLLALLVACDPACQEFDMDATLTAEQLTSALTIVPRNAGNNNLTFVTSPAQYIKVYDAETDEMVASGTMPTFQVVPPAREVSFYVTTVGQDGSIVKSSAKSLQVSEFTDLPAIYNDLFGDGAGGFTAHTWVWNDAVKCWGNGGYLEHTAPNWWTNDINQTDQEAIKRGLLQDGKDGWMKLGWWKCYVNQEVFIEEQAIDKGLPKDGKDGWMKLGLSGVEMSRGDKGSIKVNENKVKPGWDIGQMNFKGTYPLLGIQPNGGNAPQYEYHILQADGTNLTLCAPEPGAGDWGTAWFWVFKKK